MSIIPGDWPSVRKLVEQEGGGVPHSVQELKRMGIDPLLDAYGDLYVSPHDAERLTVHIRAKKADERRDTEKAEAKAKAAAEATTAALDDQQRESVQRRQRQKPPDTDKAE